MILKVNTPTPYDVIIERGAIEKSGALIRRLFDGQKAMIVTDENIAPLYLDKVKSVLESEGIETFSSITTPGEEGKCFHTYKSILHNMKEARLSRADLVVALGGGAVGDTAGFAAATYMRGIKFVQIPTSLLAMVDSSVGGKNAINFDEDKNQIGTIHQPSLTIIDTSFLDALPEREMASGFAEIIKCGMIADKKLFKILSKDFDEVTSMLEEIIATCVRIKLSIVESDEKEVGPRKLLNFGHTIGHAIESISGGSISHGEAVAIGMAQITRRASALGYCDMSINKKLSDLLSKYNLPSELPYDMEEIHEHIRHDKKADGDRIDAVIPKKIGKCIIKSVPLGDILMPPSKSYEHRYLIGDFLSGEKTNISASSIDTITTAKCLDKLRALKPKKSITLNCRESASTLHFLMPIVCALGINATFVLAKSLAKRPHDELINVLKSHGARIKFTKDKKKGARIECSGKLSSGSYEIRANISSQYISGLLFALPLLNGNSTLTVKGEIVSKNYINITEDVLSKYSINFQKTDNTYYIPGGGKYVRMESPKIEGDWSSAVPVLCIAALSDTPISIKGLNKDSLQGDKKIINVLKSFGAIIKEGEDFITVQRGEMNAFSFDGADCPDIIPAISILAMVAEGTSKISGIKRLRIKECDRLKAVVKMIRTLGGDAVLQDDEVDDDEVLIITGTKNLHGGNIKAYGDHRIAMAAGVARFAVQNDIVIDEKNCVSKSYPNFWNDLDSLLLK